MQEWDTSCRDWRERITAGQSLCPALPLHQKQAALAVAVFDRLRLPDVVDDLLRPRGVFTELAAERDGPLWQYLSARSGISIAWRDACIPTTHVRAEDLAFAVASWALCVEYVHDLQHREPTDERLRAMDALPRPVIEACRELAVHLRARPDEFYRRTADETERRIEAEIKAARAEDLGHIDTFRFEEDKVLTAALEALATARWDAASTWAELRLRGPSFWLRIEPPRQLAWELVRDVARLGQAIVAAGDRLGELASLDEAVARYTSHGAAVDRAHRHLERRRGTISTTTPYYERLRERLDAARQRWSTWADAWARDFNALCRAHGFLPGSQRSRIWCSGCRGERIQPTCDQTIERSGQEHDLICWHQESRYRDPACDEQRARRRSVSRILAARASTAKRGAYRGCGKPNRRASCRYQHRRAKQPQAAACVDSFSAQVEAVDGARGESCDADAVGQVVADEWKMDPRAAAPATAQAC